MKHTKTSHEVDYCDKGVKLSLRTTQDGAFVFSMNIADSLTETTWDYNNCRCIVSHYVDAQSVKVVEEFFQTLGLLKEKRINSSGTTQNLGLGAAGRL